MGQNVSTIALTVASGDTVSAAITNLGDAAAIGIASPAALSGTITVQIEATASGTSYIALQSGGSDVTVTASKMLQISPVTFQQLRLAASTAQTGARSFTLTKAVERA